MGHYGHGHPRENYHYPLAIKQLLDGWDEDGKITNGPGYF